MSGLARLGRTRASRPPRPKRLVSPLEKVSPDLGGLGSVESWARDDSMSARDGDDFSVPEGSTTPRWGPTTSAGLAVKIKVFDKESSVPLLLCRPPDPEGYTKYEGWSQTETRVQYM